MTTEEINILEKKYFNLLVNILKLKAQLFQKIFCHNMQLEKIGVIIMEICLSYKEV